jgi:hypothetical protein
MCQKKSLTTMWTCGSQMGQEYRTALGQVYMDPMGSLSMIFSAEVVAILRCTELLLTKNLTRRRIHICSDSRAAIVALAKTTTKSSLVWKCMQVLEN